MNLIHRDLTNLRIAKYLDADCILVADIEKGRRFRSNNWALLN